MPKNPQNNFGAKGIIMPCPEISKLLTSKPSQPYRGTFKPDLAVFVNLDTLITNLLSFFPAVASLSSTSASFHMRG